MTYKAEIPYGAYWSTPFARWQGSFANLHSMEFAAHVARTSWRGARSTPKRFDYGVLGFSVPQNHSFFGLPWLTGPDRRRQVGGPTIMQACATGVRTLLAAAQEIEVGVATPRSSSTATAPPTGRISTIQIRAARAAPARPRTG